MKKLIGIIICLVLVISTISGITYGSYSKRENYEQKICNLDLQPGGWTEEVYSGTGHWEASTTAYVKPYNWDESCFLAADSDGNVEDIYDVEIFTPAMDMTEEYFAIFECDATFRSYVYSESGSINVYSGPEKNLELQLYFADEDTDEELHHFYTFNPSTFSDPSEVYLGFWYSTGGENYCWGFSVDNVQIYGDLGNYLDEDFNCWCDEEPPVVVIESPEDGSEFSEPEIILAGVATDNEGIASIGFKIESESGENDTGSQSVDPPENTYLFTRIFWLEPGENKITVYVYDPAGNYAYAIITIYYHPQGEGFLISGYFQPVQTVFPDDGTYPTDIVGGACDAFCTLDMVAGKNTYIMGYPYDNRFTLDLTACNFYDEPKTFSWVFKIMPDDKEIWRSDAVTVPAKSTMTFIYDTPLPSQPFQWDSWSDAAKTKPGSIILYIDPDHTSDNAAPCQCRKITLNLNINKTHDLEVLFVPFTLGDGPTIPPSLANIDSATEFDTWRWDTLEPWWNGIYPVEENDVKTYRNWLGNIQKNLTVDGITVNNATKFKTLNRIQVLKLWSQLFTASAALSWMKAPHFDRIVWLIHPDLMDLPANATHGPISNANGLAYLCPPSTHKQGVLVNWSQRSKTAPHEISHTYGLIDCYKAPDTQSKAVGYYVNKNIDITNRKDLMWVTHPINDCWIKKPNFKSLMKRFTNEEDPKVIGISGYINRNDNCQLKPWYQLDQGVIDLDWGLSGQYLIKAYDTDGKLIDETGFDLDYTLFVENCGDIEIDNAPFSFRVEMLDELYRIDIINSNSNQVLASRSKTDNSPQITITSPVDNEEIKQGIYKIEWIVDDADGDTTSCNILIRKTSDENWFPIDINNEEESLIFDFSNHPKDEYQLSVFATDGWNTAEEKVSFTIREKGKSKCIEKSKLIFQILNILKTSTMFQLLKILLKPISQFL